MQLSSERLTYKKFIDTDLEDYKRQAMDYEVMKYIGGKALNEEETKQRFQKILNVNSLHDKLGIFAVREKEDGNVIGLAKFVKYNNAGVKTEENTDEVVEIGYALEPDFWGKGYATEITKYFTEYAKTLENVYELIGLADPENVKSINVLKKCGYEFFEEGSWNGFPALTFKIKIKARQN